MIYDSNSTALKTFYESAKNREEREDWMNSCEAAPMIAEHRIETFGIYAKSVYIWLYDAAENNLLHTDNWTYRAKKAAYFVILSRRSTEGRTDRFIYAVEGIVEALDLTERLIEVSK